MKELKAVFSYALYFVLPLVFFAVIYLMAGFYYMDLNPNNWTDSTRLLIALEGLVFMGIGGSVAHSVNSKNN